MLYNKQSETFYGADNREINLTPMQFELMQMFLKQTGTGLLKLIFVMLCGQGKIMQTKHFIQ